MNPETKEMIQLRMSLLDLAIRVSVNGTSADEVVKTAEAFLAFAHPAAKVEG